MDCSVDIASETICAEQMQRGARCPSQGKADFIMQPGSMDAAATAESKATNADPAGLLARADEAFRAHENECAMRIAATEQDIERLRRNLDATMGSLARAFEGLAAEGAGSGTPTVEAAVMAIQFQDIGGQWLAHIAKDLRETRGLMEELRVPFDVVKLAATGDWHGFERGARAWDGMDRSLNDLRTRQASHPVGDVTDLAGDVELF